MKGILFCLALTSLFSPVWSQSGSEWINYSQPYYKIPVAREGLYRLTSADLQNAGISIATIDPQTFQIFHRGVEQAIYVEGEADHQFDPIDFIEFYGRKNDGTLDAELYRPSSVQPHLYYNLYNDTTAYFLTYNAQAGKRMSFFSELNETNILKETSHMEEKLLILKDQYATGYTVSDVQNTFFDQGEGWTGIQITQGQTRDYTITDLVHGLSADGLPALEMLLVGRWAVSHQAEIYVGPTSSSLRLLATANSFSGYETRQFLQPLAWTDIGADGKMVVRIKAVGTNDRLSASYIKVIFPQQFNMSGGLEKFFQLRENASEKAYIEIENPASGTRLYDVTDPANVVQIGTTSTITLNAIIPSATTTRKIFATAATLSAAIKPVHFRQIIPAQHDFIMISHSLLMKPASGYNNPVKAYAEYRASAEGGLFDTLVVDMNLLYNQFSYGETTPLAIFHFMKFLTASHTPNYLFLIGKGLNVNYNYYRNPGAFTTYKDFVPAAGMPAADMLYTAGLNGTMYEPAVPTGRIPATSPADVAAYLNKVKEAEALPFNALWRKDILHLSGGIEEGEPEQFKQILESYEAIAEDYHFGGKVTAIAKQSREVLQDVDVSKQVNAGLNLVTFFGHSSAGTLDFDIGFVTNPVLGYNNKGKYPMFLINGCNAGAFFLNGEIWGEDWINAEDKGAVGFIAHSFFGLVGTLQRYSNTFYNVGFSDSTFIQKGIGDIQKEVARKYMSTAVASIHNITQVQQMFLLGDPAVKLFGAKKADYEVVDENIFIDSFNGEPVTALTDSFALKIIVRNFGQAKEGIFRVEVERKLSNNTVITYDSLYSPVFYSDTLTLIIRKDRTPAFGNNTFTVTLDPDGIIPEIREDNNTAVLNFFIPSNGTQHLFPRPYAIVHDSELNFSFQSTDLLSGEREFIFELDTINTFDSPYKQQFTVTGKVLAMQQVLLLPQDSLAYYWRTKLAQPLPGESSDWKVSSFSYINGGSAGWAQIHFPQFLDNSTEGLVPDPPLRKFKYNETITDVAIRTFGAAYPTVITDFSVKIAGAEYNLVTQGFVCRYNTLNLIAFDRRSTIPYIGVPFKWYNRAGRACGREPWVINSFKPGEMVTGNGDDLIAYVDHIIPGDSVVLYNIGDAGYASWPAAAKLKLGELGISVAQIDNLLVGEPVVIFGRKGLAPGTASVFRATTAPENQQELLVNKTITGRYTSGSTTSVLIGPAQQWQALITHVNEIETEDQFSFDVTGQKLNGEETLLFADVSGDQDLSTLDAALYPYLKVTFKTKDNVNLTAAQLKKWLVLYEPVAEGMLVFAGSPSQQVLFEGQTWEGTFGFVNISDKVFTDKLMVNYESFNSSMRTSFVQNFSIDAPQPGDTTWFNVAFASADKEGLNDINVRVNPKILPEQYYDNNVLQMLDYINVEVDAFDPVLEVTIDDRLVANGDFVSPNPSILAKLWDENHFILKTDTTDVKLFLTYPCGSDDCEPTPVYFSRSDITWHAATDSTDFWVLFNPHQLSEGEYKLQVSAGDAQGNMAEYEVNFIVLDETTVSFSAPYPNPFAASALFTVKISGSIAPDKFFLHITDLNGRSIAELNETNTKPLIIGTNEISWDGTNNSRAAVSDGLYVYTLQLSIAGKTFCQVGKIVRAR